MEIKEKARERLELRIYAQETLKAIIEWIQSVKPSEWIPPTGKDNVLTTDEIKTHWRDYVDRGSRLIEKAWRPAELLIDDLTSFMEEVCAKPKSPPESK